MNCSIPQHTWLSIILMKRDRDDREIETERTSGGKERREEEKRGKVG